MTRLLATLTMIALCLQCSTPSPRQADATVPPLLGRLSSPDPAVSAAACKQIEALPETQRIRLLLRGLHLEHRPTAVWCAARLEWNQVNAEEASLLVELLTPELFKDARHTDVDFDRFRYNLSSEELGPILRRLGTAPVTVRKKTEMFSHLHRHLRPEHYPILCDIYLKADVEVASTVMGNLSVAVARTLRNKEAIGRAILQRRFNAREKTEGNRYGLDDQLTPWQPESDPHKRGYTSLLHELLKEFFITDRVEKGHEPFKKWLFRWSLTETPADVDRPLLLDMLRRPNFEGRLIAAHGLYRLGGVECRKPLEAWLEENKTEESRWDWGVSAYCLMTLDRCGDPNARKELLELAKVDRTLVGYLAHHDLEAAVKIFCEPLDGDTRPEAARQMASDLEGLTECDLTGAGYFDSLLPDGFYDGVDRRLQASALSGFDLARICQQLPNPSRRLVLESARRLRQDKHDEKKQDYEHLKRFLSLLEVTDLKKLRGILRRAVRNGNMSACKPLLAVAEQQDAVALVRWRETRVVYGLGDWARLGFLNHPEVRRRIEEGCAGETIDADCVRALGHYHGLPADFWWGGFEGLGDSDERELLRLLRANKPVEAVLFALERQGGLALQQLGKLRDPRITTCLRDARRHRHHGAYWLATQELARQGDMRCRRTVERICRMGRYQWIEENALLDEIAIPGPDPAWIRFWASELETNCCRAATADNILKGRVSFFYREDWWHTYSAAATVEACLRRCGNQLAWSRVMQRFVPVPR